MARSIATLDGAAAERLAKLCGMFGSAHAGERAVAAAKAEQLVRGLGLTWFDVLQPQKPQQEHKSLWRDPGSDDEALRFARVHREMLSPWERKFVFSVHSGARLSPKQQSVLGQIVDKLRDAFECEAA